MVWRNRPPGALASAAVLATYAMALSMLSGGSAFVIVDKRTIQRSVNGTVTAVPSGTFTCESQDALTNQVVSNLNTDGTIVVQTHHCPNIFHEASAQLHGYSPEYGSFETSEVAMVRSVIPFLALNTTINPIASFQSPTGRRLLQYPVEQPYGWDGNTQAIRAKAGLFTYAFGQPVAQPIEVYTGSGDQTVKNVWTADNITACLCQQMLSTTGEMDNFQQCVRGPNTDVFNQLTYSIGNFTDNLGRFLTDTASLSEAQAEAMANLTKATGYIVSAENQTSAAIDQLENTARLTNEANNQMTASVTAEVNQQLAQAVTISSSNQNNLAQLSAIVSVTSNATDKFTKALAQVFEALNSNLQSEMTDYLGERAVLMRQYLHQNTINNDAVNTVQEFILDTQMLTAQNRQLQKILTRMATTLNPQGVALLPFDEDVGQAPAPDFMNMPTAFRQIPSSNGFFKSVVVSGGIPYGVITRIVSRSESYGAVTTGSRNPDWNILSKLLGPAGCDATFTAPTLSGRCKTVDIPNEDRCVLQNTAGVVSPSVLAMFFASDGATLDATTGCIALGEKFTPALGGFDDMVIRGQNESLLLFVGMSKRGLYPGTGWKFVNLFTNLAIDVIEYNPDLNSMTNFQDAMALPARTEGRNNLLWIYWQTRPDSWAVMMQNSDAYRNAYFGTLPNYTYQKRIFYRRFTVESTGVATRVGLMFYSNSLLTLSSLSLIDTLAPVRVDFSTKGNVTVTDATVNSPFLYQLNDVIAPGTSILWDPATFATRFWDIPHTSLSLSPFRGNREYMVNYASVPEMAQFARNIWSFLAGSQFKHEAGGNVASAYAVERDGDPNSPTYGQCLTAAQAPGGAWCFLFEHFRAFAAGVFNDPTILGRFLFQDLSGSVTYTVEQPEGTAVFVSNTTCPTIRFIPTLANSVRAIAYEISNPTGLVASFGIQQTGACPFTQQFTQVPAYWSTTLVRSVCNGDQLVGTYTGSSGQTVICGGAKTVNLTVASAKTFVGAASLNTTNAMHVRSNDILYLSIAKKQYAVLSFQLQVIRTELRARVRQNLSIPVNVQTSYQSIINSLDAQRAAIAAQITASRNATNQINPNPTQQIDIQIAQSQQASVILADQYQRSQQLIRDANANAIAAVNNVAVWTTIADADAANLGPGFDRFQSVFTQLVVQTDGPTWAQEQYENAAKLAKAFGDSGDGAKGAEFLDGLFGNSFARSFSVFGKNANMVGAFFLVIVIAGVIAVVFVLPYYIYDRNKGPRTITYWFNSEVIKKPDRIITARVNEAKLRSTPYSSGLPLSSLSSASSRANANALTAVEKARLLPAD